MRPFVQYNGTRPKCENFFLFSDKTGTLTQNIMTFNKCAIGGRSYGDIIDEKTGEPIDVDEVRYLGSLPVMFFCASLEC